jgi:glycosyltransferase involved in cell wall biosynthesis/protein-tyrosine-phosphatase
MASPLRVCHVMSADLWAGAEAQVAVIASYLVEQPAVSLSVVLFNDGRLAGELRRLGIPVTVLDERDRSAVGIVACLTRFLAEHAIDVVHTHRYKDNLLGTIAAKLAGVPRVVRTVHGLPEPMRGWDRLKFRLFDALDRIAIWCCADAVIAVSRHTAEALKRSGCRQSIVRVVHNGLNLPAVKAARSREEVRRELGVPPRAFLVGTAGRLSAVKAQDSLIRAARLIRRHRRDATLVIVGDGPLRHDLAGLASRLGIDRHVRFTGARADVFDLVAAMDVFALPSLHEGVPMAVLEAMALGTPVVATAVGGVPEIVTDGVSGLLVPVGDDRALAGACVDLAQNPHWARALSACAQRVVHEDFSREINGKAVMDLYRAVAPSPRVSTAWQAGMGRPGAARLGWVLVRGLVEHTRRKASRALEIARQRRRMRRVRRDPALLARTLRTAQRILIVCHGNIIRSPFAARLVAQATGGSGRVSVTSAGLGAVPGRPPHPTAALLAAARRVDLSDHAASSLAPEAVAASDVIFVMDVPQLIAMHQRFPEARGRTFLLTCLASDAPLEIRDPVDGDESRFQSCFDHISTAVRPIVHTLSDGAIVQ